MTYAPLKVDTGVNPNNVVTHLSPAPSSFRASGFTYVDGMGTNTGVYTYYYLSGISGEKKTAFRNPPPPLYEVKLVTAAIRQQESVRSR